MILSQPSTIIGEVPNNAAIFHVSGLQSKLNSFYSNYPNLQISLEQLDLVYSSLKKLYHRKTWKIDVNREKLTKGALCRECDYKYVMQYEHGRFVCPVCRLKSKKALFEALNDYRFLFKPWINNGEFREFFNISSNDASNKVLKRMKLPYEGVNRARKYYIPDNILELADK